MLVLLLLMLLFWYLGFMVYMVCVVILLLLLVLLFGFMYLCLLVCDFFLVSLNGVFCIFGIILLLFMV